MAESLNKRPNPILQLTLMRLREIGREPGVLFWALCFPVVMSLALGIAFRARGPEPVVVGALPGISAEAHRALADAKVTVKPMDGAAAEAELRAGRVSLLLAPPPGPGQPLVYRFDPARAEARTARAAVNQILQRAAGQTEPRLVRDEEVHEPGSRYIDFLIPGLIAMNLMSGSMWGVAWVVVQMRVRKLLKRMLAAPMRRHHLMYAFGLARLVIIPLELIVILVFSRLAFSVQVTAVMPRAGGPLPCGLSAGERCLGTPALLALWLYRRCPRLRFQTLIQTSTTIRDPSVGHFH